jgi:hypothetical protein
MAWTEFTRPRYERSCLVAEKDGRVIGICDYLFHASTWSTQPICYLQDLYVDRDARGTRGRYASDVSDAEWALVAPLMPVPKKVGRPRTTDLRDVFDAILYIATTGCQWRMLPNDFPPVSTVRRYFYDWRDNGLL